MQAAGQIPIWQAIAIYITETKLQKALNLSNLFNVIVQCNCSIIQWNCKV